MREKPSPACSEPARLRFGNQAVWARRDFTTVPIVERPIELIQICCDLRQANGGSAFLAFLAVDSGLNIRPLMRGEYPGLFL